MALTVESAFNELLGRQGLTSRQRALAFSRTDDIRDFVANRCVMAEPVFSIGSFARGTMCEGERDIDLMMILDVETYWRKYQADSSTFLYDCRETLAERYPRTDVSSKRVAVVLDFEEIRTEVVPGFRRQGGGYLIPNGQGAWQGTNPRCHNQLVADSDELFQGKLKPVIKFLKLWNLSNGRHLSSIHVELMVVATEKSPIVDWPFDVTWCLRRFPDVLSRVFADPWPPGESIDRALRRDERELAIRLLQADSKRASEAEDLRKASRHSEAIERWRVVYGSTVFPAFG